MTFSNYENIIHADFLQKNRCGIQLHKIGASTDCVKLPVKSSYANEIDMALFKKETQSITSFIEKKFKKTYVKPIWFKINITDQAFNEYAGIGLLNMNDNWLDLVLSFLSFDRADQGGDTILTIFDTAFNWAVNFGFSRDEEMLTIEKFQK
jgi:hypothetical protein